MPAAAIVRLGWAAVNGALAPYDSTRGGDVGRDRCSDCNTPQGVHRPIRRMREEAAGIHREVASSLTVSPDQSEAELVGRAKARSPAAWTEIYRAHYAAIFRYSKARVFDEATAEDISSAVFLAALKGIDSYRYRGRPLLAWLYSIARNVVGSHQRKILGGRTDKLRQGLDLSRRVLWHLLRAQRSEARAADHDLTRTASEADPAMMVDRLDLRDALAKLPASQREVVILRFLVGLSAQEVAAVTGKRPAAVYSLQARAILALREQLE